MKRPVASFGSIPTTEGVPRVPKIRKNIDSVVKKSWGNIHSLYVFLSDRQMHTYFITIFIFNIFLNYQLHTVANPNQPLACTHVFFVSPLFRIMTIWEVNLGFVHILCARQRFVRTFKKKLQNIIIIRSYCMYLILFIQL